MKAAVEIVLFLLLAVLVLGSLLTLSSHPHWLIRGWDFPRVQIIVIGWLIVIAFGIWRLCGFGPAVLSYRWFLLPAAFLTLWHGFLIVPYTPLFPVQAKATSAAERKSHLEDARTIRVVLSNVEKENQQYDRWLEVIENADPDVLVVLEPDEAWVDAIKPLIERYPHRVVRPQDNWYGMVMLSRLPIKEHQVRYLVQEDIPSIDAMIELENGDLMRVVAVHPRPPEPWRGNDATARDAELTIWGKELEDETMPVIIGGDLNDVAWSSTTRLFLRTSGLLDPRRGRGFFNTFHADHWFLRYPLDHVFHSPHFTVSKIQRLPKVGSDHFPMMIDLRLEPWNSDDHDVIEEKEGDDEEVQLRVERARKAEDIDGEAVDRDPDKAVLD
ncbi:endonuclease/exonuclease/phosphatase family protein [Stieleria sp. JC731]|uniref:endonuclease/exonuclease/phosphatase family protein n=1 Tax=Pirellulaceae TaxID=2691357 RepID=UPI001E3E9C79|nr:endonuclease/exonuclease/phosphatase family protein [Stieleria sp. JC731]MCC9603153.1 endonuclease/exonuclease/phosphatase family protein [Stieleria sp. JC731]